MGVGCLAVCRHAPAIQTICQTPRDTHAPERSDRPKDKSFSSKGASMFEGLFQPMHLLVIFGVALLVFGPKKLPDLGNGIDKGIRHFRSAWPNQHNPLPPI